MLWSGLEALPAAKASGSQITKLPDYQIAKLPLRHYRFRHACFLEGAWLAVQVIFKLFSEFFYECHRRHRGCVSQRAERFSQHVFREVINVIDVFLYSR